ncbi:hypothetical protein SRHO_G00194580 [Serrasalmus rhombeus]
MDLSGTSAFYQSVLRAWSVALRTTRSEVQLCSLVEEEPLFYSPLIPVTELTFRSIHLGFQGASIIKLGDLRVDEDWKSGEVLSAATEIGDYQEEEGALLSFRTPQLDGFADVSKTALYDVCVKVLHRTSLDGLKESRWLGLLASGSSPQDSWRSLCKLPIEKRTWDLQWRIVHGAVATNRHMARIDPA